MVSTDHKPSYFIFGLITCFYWSLSISWNKAVRGFHLSTAGQWHCLNTFWVYSRRRQHFVVSVSTQWILRCLQWEPTICLVGTKGSFCEFLILIIVPQTPMILLSLKSELKLTQARPIVLLGSKYCIYKICPSCLNKFGLLLISLFPLNFNVKWRYLL